MGQAKCVRTTERNNFGASSCVPCREINVLCPYLGESTIGGSTVYSCILRKLCSIEYPWLHRGRVSSYGLEYRV